MKPLGLLKPRPRTHGGESGFRPPAGEDSIRPSIDALAATLAALSARVAQLEARGGARDGADVALVVALAEVFNSTWFTAGNAWQHARMVGPTLAAALEGADVTSARELGHWLQRMQYTPAAGFAIVRGDRHGGGLRWAVRLC